MEPGEKERAFAEVLGTVISAALKNGASEVIVMRCFADGYGAVEMHIMVNPRWIKEGESE